MQDRIVPVRDQIAEQLRSDIIAGTLAPNEKLNEQALANRFGVSRGPVRDVLLQLSKEGLLVSKSNVGMSVSDTLDPALQTLMIDIRITIEVFAIQGLKDQLDEADFAAMSAILDRIKNAFYTENFTEVTKADIDFHRYLVRKAGGDDLVNLWLPIVLRMRMNYKRIDNSEDCVNEHRAIMNALQKGDIRAAVAALKANIK